MRRFSRLPILQTMSIVLCFNAALSLRADASESPFETFANDYFSLLTPGQIYEIALPDELKASFRFAFDKDVAVSDLTELSHELFGRKSLGAPKMIYLPAGTSRRQYQLSTGILITMLKMRDVKAVNLLALADLAKDRLRWLTARGTLARCYLAQGEAADGFTTEEWKCLSLDIQLRIEEPFRAAIASADISTPDFVAAERLELQALRSGCTILQQAIATDLKTSSTHIATTNGRFIQSLIDRGLVRHHAVIGVVEDPAAGGWFRKSTSALGLRNLRTGTLVRL